MTGRPQLEPGSRLDRYELLCPIAHGGMASVWLARFGGKHGFEKLVAVKTILPEFAQDSRFQQMFLDEARIASGIEHVNVAQILDLGEQPLGSENVLFLVMEWVDGDSLSKLHRAVERRTELVPLGVVLRIMADTCGGLHAAHELTDKTGRSLDVVHRDVSPQNILVSSKGNAKLIDFGIAKAVVRLSGETNAGLLKGKIQYMAPEQAMGRALDRRADVWAIGACLYYMLSGLPPYDGENQLATLHMLTGGSPPPPLPANVPPLVQELVMRALAFDMNARTPSAADLQRQLEQAMLTCGVPTTTTDVAAFVARELGDRAEARKQAIDGALAAAQNRAAGNTAIFPTGSDSGNGVRHSPLASTQATSSPSIQSPMAATYGVTPPPHAPAPSPASLQTMGSTMLAPAMGVHPSLPARTFPLGTSSEAEHPISQVSNATLGSAAVAYPQTNPPPAPRKSKGAVAVVLGVVCALAVVGGGGVIAYQKGFFKPAAASAPAATAAQKAPAPIASETAPPPQQIPTILPPAALPQESASSATTAPSASAASSGIAGGAPTESAKHAAATAPSTKPSTHSSSKPGAKPTTGKSTDYGF